MRGLQFRGKPLDCGHDHCPDFNLREAEDLAKHLNEK